MKRLQLYLLSLLLFGHIIAFSQSQRLIYHDIKTDASGKIIPWYSSEPGKAWSHMLDLVWHFWDTMRTDINGIPYYMNHQVWKPGVDDARGLGGDQFQMALSSWRLYYAYTGNERVKENMKFITDYYLSHALSASNAQWPNIPFPYNTFIYSGMYDGDMILGKDYTQPDKAGSLGLELVHLYKMTHNERYPNITDDGYLEAAINIANTLVAHVTDGDENSSPLPFKVNVINGKIGVLHNGNDPDTVLTSYTTNWAGTMELLMELRQLHIGDTALYTRGLEKLLNWMKKYPLQNNRWGPFFEDVPGWSDTQINAITFAQFIMNHPEYFPGWQTSVKNIFDWVYEKLGNYNWKNYGVIPINEQTAYRVPGNSHTSRQGSAELQYVSLTGDRSRFDNALRQLHWATYMVDVDGKNRYPEDDNWLTDGYGDYVRHYLRAMAAIPELSPADEDHILSSTSVIQQANYAPAPASLTGELGSIKPQAVKIFYKTFDESGTEQVRLQAKPSAVWIDNKPLSEKRDLSSEGFAWKPFSKGGLLTIKRDHAHKVVVVK